MEKLDNIMSAVMTGLEKKLKILREFINNNSGLFLILVVFLTIYLINGCEYKTYVEPKIVVDTTKVISFNNDIIPILKTNCDKSGCHSSASKIANLDLSQANAYQQITSKALIDTLNPETSTIYKKINTGGSMINYGTPELRNNILLWIKQGAKNN